MAEDEPLPRNRMWLAIHDLYLLCTRDLTVLYLAGLEPRDGCCPVKSCRQQMNMSVCLLSFFLKLRI